MTRALVLIAVLVVALATATAAGAAIFLRLGTVSANRGGIVQLVGNADHMPLYALPNARMPCARHNTCPAAPIHLAAPPKRPFVFLGHTPDVDRLLPPTRAFQIRLPRALRPGLYKVFVWCRPCGGSLIIVGRDSSGQTLRVRR
jgi:hypothetical protein